MSNLPVQQGAALDAAYQQRVLEADAARIARSSFLPDWLRLDANKRPRPTDAIEADCLVIGMTARDLGIPFNIVTLQKMPVIKGAVDVMAQMLMGLVSARGHDCWVEERSMEQAVVCLKNSRTGRTHRVEYTLAEAKNTPQYNSNPTWKTNPADMLIARAVRRAVRLGAPEVLATFPDDYDDVPPPPLNVDPETGEIASDPVPPAIVATVKEDAAPVLRVRRRIDMLPDAWKNALRLAWQAKGIPSLVGGEFGPEHVEAAEEVIDAIIAEALRQATWPAPEFPTPAEGNGKSDEPPGTPVAESRHREGADGQAEGTPEARYPAPNPDRPRPLAQQIAISAQQVGVDHHHVIAAITSGAKSSAKTVTNEEGQRTLEAIRAINDGFVVLVERDGGWHLDDPPKASQLFGPGEEPFS